MRWLTICPCVAVLAALAALPPLARPAERITLRNGFEMRCDHHVEVDGRTRLYLSAGEDSYIERLPEDIVNIETISNPQPPKSEVNPASAKPAKTNPIVAPNAMREAKLSEADLREMLNKAGHEHNLDVDLLASLVKAESGGDQRALSRAGARGLMQLMPTTARDMGVTDSYKPEENVRGGTAYLDAMLARYHDNLALALAAYNAGPDAVDKYHDIPPYHETRAYVARVIHEFNRRVLAREAQAKRTDQRH
jgi:soluble lytic murein transglycosylase-like protein